MTAGERLKGSFHVLIYYCFSTTFRCFQSGVNKIHKNRWLHIFLGLAVTVACLWYSVKDVEWNEIRTSFSDARYDTIPLYLLALAAFFWLKAIRWAWLLYPVKQVSTRQVASPMMVGFMGNNLLPAHLGELFRIFLLGRQQKFPAAAVFTSVAIERVLDVFAVLILVGIGLLGVRDIPESMQAAFQSAGILALILVVFLVAGLIWLKQALRLIVGMIQRLPVSNEKREKLIDLAHHAAEGTAALRQGRLLVALILNSLMQWSCNCLMIYISLRSFGIDIPFSATLILLGVLIFAVTIPSTPGFFGLIQAAFVGTLDLFSVSEENAFAASIYYHLIQYVVVTAVGLFCLARSGFSLSQIQQASEQTDNEETGEETLIDVTSQST